MDSMVEGLALAAAAEVELLLAVGADRVLTPLVLGHDLRTVRTHPQHQLLAFLIQRPVAGKKHL